MLTVQMIGIMHFDGCRVDGEKTVYLPNGVDFDQPHYASVFIEEGGFDSDWWPDLMQSHNLPAPVNKVVRELRMPNLDRNAAGQLTKPRVITFPDEDEGRPVCSNFDRPNGLYKIPDDEFLLDRQNPEAIAVVRVRGGELEPFRFGRVSVITWKIRNPPDMQIVATAGGESKKIVIKKSRSGDAEIVLSNTSSFFHALKQRAIPNPQPTTYHEDHFVLYGKLDVKRRTNLTRPGHAPTGLGELTPNHPYLKSLKGGSAYSIEFPDFSCTPTCCSS